MELEGKKYCYLVNCPKCLLIVKTQDLAGKAEQIFGEEVNITTEGKRHLGFIMGSKEYKDHAVLLETKFKDRYKIFHLSQKS